MFVSFVVTLWPLKLSANSWIWRFCDRNWLSIWLSHSLKIIPVILEELLFLYMAPRLFLLRFLKKWGFLLLLMTNKGNFSQVKLAVTRRVHRNRINRHRILREFLRIHVKYLFIWYKNSREFSWFYGNFTVFSLKVRLI